MQSALQGFLFWYTDYNTHYTNLNKSYDKRSHDQVSDHCHVGEEQLNTMEDQAKQDRTHINAL